jgi:hypothetical protein
VRSAAVALASVSSAGPSRRGPRSARIGRATFDILTFGKSGCLNKDREDKWRNFGRRRITVITKTPPEGGAVGVEIFTLLHARHFSSAVHLSTYSYLRCGI